MTEHLKPAIVRFFAKNNVVGAGLLVGERKILTCAHVVRDALKLRTTPDVPPQSEIRLDFPFSAWGEILTAHVVFWQPSQPDGSGDIAVLWLNGFPPKTSHPVDLLKVNTISELWGHSFRAYGFPKGNDKGVWASGTLQEERPGGSVQFKDENVTGHRVQGGFSGGPVWDKELEGVVGITVTAALPAQLKVAFMIPTKAIFKACPELERPPEVFKGLDIPVVIVAMNHDEATNLMTEAIFKHPSVAPIEQLRFQNLKKALTDYGVTDWLPYYDQQREGWKPLTYGQDTIQEIVVAIFKYENQRRSEKPDLPRLQPNFYSEDFFAQDEDVRLELWNELGRSGCLIIVDALSMFHPTLRHLFLGSEMGSNERVAMLVLSPINASAIPVNQLIEQEISSQMQRAFARAYRYWDQLCEFGVGDLRVLQRWLFTILSETAKTVQNQSAYPTNRNNFRKLMGKPQGVEQLFSGRRGG